MRNIRILRIVSRMIPPQSLQQDGGRTGSTGHSVPWQCSIRRKRKAHTAVGDPPRRLTCHSETGRQSRAETDRRVQARIGRHPLRCPRSGAAAPRGIRFKIDSPAPPDVALTGSLGEFGNGAVNQADGGAVPGDSSECCGAGSSVPATGAVEAAAAVRLASCAPSSMVTPPAVARAGFRARPRSTT